MRIIFDADGRLSFADLPTPRDPAAPRPMLALRADRVGLPAAALAQPKIDGVRAILTPAGLFTRYGRRIASCPQIAAPGLDATLDGEIYRHGAPLETIAGAVRANDPTEASLTLEFHVFDTLADAPAIERQRALDRISADLPLTFRRVETAMLDTPEDMDRHYRRCLASGYEGQMLRDPAAFYTPRRCAAIVKRKPFEDMECRVLAIRRRGDDAVAATLLESSGATFNAFLRAGISRRLSAPSTARTVIGCEATVRHWGRTARGLPRHAVLHQIHDGGRAA